MLVPEMVILESVLRHVELESDVLRLSNSADQSHSSLITSSLVMLTALR